MHTPSTSTRLTVGKLLGPDYWSVSHQLWHFSAYSRHLLSPGRGTFFLLCREFRYQHPLFSANLARRSNREPVAHFVLRRIVARASSCRQDSGRAWSASPAGLFRHDGGHVGCVHRCTSCMGDTDLGWIP